MHRGAPSDRPRALVVDDTPAVCRLVGALLELEGFAVEEAADGRAAVGKARSSDPDLIVLDVGLPEIDGVRACRAIREFSDAYVLMLTGQAGEVDKVAGFAAGADDYVTKPFSTPELLARVRALRRRPRAAAPERARAERDVRDFGAVRIDADAREVWVEGVAVELTRIEFDLLDALSGAPRVAFSRSTLLERVWGPNWFGDDHLVDVHVSNLRRKLGDDPRAPRFVWTVRGVGYRMGAGA